MNCPEHLILDLRYLRIWHIQRADVPRQYVTRREILNPLRYEIILKAPGKWWCWNEDAWMNRAASNIWFRLWGYRKYKRKGRK